MFSYQPIKRSPFEQIGDLLLTPGYYEVIYLGEELNDGSILAEENQEAHQITLGEGDSRTVETTLVSVKDSARAQALHEELAETARDSN